MLFVVASLSTSDSMVARNNWMKLHYLNKAYDLQMRIQNHVKHLIWNFIQKQELSQMFERVLNTPLIGVEWKIIRSSPT